MINSLTFAGFPGFQKKWSTCVREELPLVNKVLLNVAKCCVIKRRVPELIPVLGSQPAGDVES